MSGLDLTLRRPARFVFKGNGPEPGVSEQIEFHAADGFALAGTVHRPRADPRFALLISSGTGFPRTFYDAFGAHAAARGGLALTYDYRGIGGSRPTDLAAMTMDYPGWGPPDLPAAAAALAKRAGGLPLLHGGHGGGPRRLAPGLRLSRHRRVAADGPGGHDHGLSGLGPAGLALGRRGAGQTGRRPAAAARRAQRRRAPGRLHARAGSAGAARLRG